MRKKLKQIKKCDYNLKQAIMNS